MCCYIGVLLFPGERQTMQFTVKSGLAGQSYLWITAETDKKVAEEFFGNPQRVF